MNYVDGFVLAVPTERKEAYVEHSCVVAAMFKEYGALSVVECWGDDIPEGELTSFPMSVNCEADETVCFSWISWLSKEVRDEAMKLVIDDPRMAPENTTVPFDGKRMIFGGFEVIVNK